jgi:GNAT superfamily N-acetyltransferase
MRDELLRIEYGLERLLWQDPDQNQLDVWEVTLQTGELDDEAETGVRWQPIARAVLYGIDIDRCLRVGESPFDVADAHSADVAYYYEHVLEVSGEFKPDVEEEFEWPPSRALFLHDVKVDAGQRRKGYASLLAADAILTLAPQGTAVFAHPGPTDLESTDEDDLARLRSQTENTRFLASLGFQPFRDRMWLLDLATEDAVETLGGIRRGSSR